jgi:hypothetical protein
MTKPTGRPRGRPKTKEYVTVMARVPLDLADQAKRYASRKRQTMSDVLRDGLLVLFQEEDTYPPFVYDRNTHTERVSALDAVPPENTSDINRGEPEKVSDTNGVVDNVSDIKEDDTPLLPENVSDTKAALVTQKQCRYGHEPYDASKPECPTCVRNRKRRSRERSGR